MHFPPGSSRCAAWPYSRGAPQRIGLDPRKGCEVGVECRDGRPRSMSRPYSLELREQVVRAVERGLSRRRAAQWFDVSLGFVVKLMQRWSRDHSLAPKRTQIHGLAAHAALVRTLVAARPGITIDELRQRLAENGIRVGRASVGRFLVATGLTCKIRRSMKPGDLPRSRSLPSGQDGTRGPLYIERDEVSFDEGSAIPSTRSSQLTPP